MLAFVATFPMPILGLTPVATADVQAEAAAEGLEALSSELARDVRAFAAREAANTAGGGELEAAALRAQRLQALAKAPRGLVRLQLQDTDGGLHGPVPLWAALAVSVLAREQIDATAIDGGADAVLPLPALVPEQAAFLTEYMASCAHTDSPRFSPRFSPWRWEAASFAIAVGLQQRLADAFGLELMDNIHSRREFSCDEAMLEALDPTVGMLLELLSDLCIVAFAGFAPQPVRSWVEDEFRRRKSFREWHESYLDAKGKADSGWSTRRAEFEPFGAGTTTTSTTTCLYSSAPEVPSKVCDICGCTDFHGENDVGSVDGCLSARAHDDSIYFGVTRCTFACGRRGEETTGEAYGQGFETPFSCEDSSTCAFAGCDVPVAGTILRCLSARDVPVQPEPEPAEPA